MALRWAMMALLVAGLLLQQGTVPVNAEWFEVGSKNGWTFPPNGIATFFNDWAKEITFHVGDTLFFRYQYHSVLEVSQADVASCTITSPINSYDSVENATVTLDRTGYYGFICGQPSHCVANMKLELTALAPGEVAAPAGAPPVSAGPSVPSLADGPGVGPAASQNGASIVRSFPAILAGALLAACGFLFL